MSSSAKMFLGAMALLAVAASGASCSVDAYCFSCEDAGTTQVPGGGGAGGSLACSLDKDCPNAQKCCSNACVDTQSSADHCGACGTACDAALNGSASCDKGSCTLKCADGYGDCNLLSIDGCEALVSSDPLNCGACGKPCVLANAVAGCAMSKCDIAMCKGGFADCNMKASDGCESNLGSDPDNCKTCGDKCPAPPNSTASCVAGVCGKGGCIDGYGDCDNDLANGCETKLGDDTLNCGTCGTVCPSLPQAAAGCIAGVCGVGVCNPGYADCDKSIWSGCESLLASDVNNCGSCGTQCGAVAHGFPKCDASTCAIGGCDNGYADCNGILADGCEVNLAADLQNCGACMNACPAIANGTPSCSGFACGLDSCNAGFADCFGGAADGCETNLKTDVNHCGTCATVCPVPFEGAKSCVAGVCGVTNCAMGFLDCNNLPADGCEVNIETDLANCGSCNAPCPVPPNASATCAAGACGLGTCNAGFSDCNKNPADGCEFNTLNDPLNCGGCGIKCGSGSCVNAACVCPKPLSVLLIADDSPTGSATLAAALTTQGYVVTQTAVPSYQYTGANPSPAGFGAIVLLAGGPGSTSFSTDMPAAGQTAIVNFVNSSGNGLVLTEWAAYQVASNRWQTLAPLVLLNRTVAYTGQVTYTVDPGFAGHPIWAGLPGTFTFASNSNVGTANALNGATRIAGSAQALDAVAIRDVPVGRVVHVSHAGNYAPNGWTNSNVQKLIGNAVGWSARCQ